MALNLYVLINMQITPINMEIRFIQLINMQMTLIDTRINFISQINILINVAPDSLAPSVNLTCTFIIIWRTCGRQPGGQAN